MAFITITSKPFINGSIPTIHSCQFSIKSTSISIKPCKKNFSTLIRMTTVPPQSDDTTITTSSTNPNTTSNSTSVSSTEPYELDTDALKEKAMEVVSDVSTRPFYYGKIIAYAIGAIVGITVLRAVVSAVDSIPVLPAALELIGLGYTVWFVWRYVLFQESRQELLDEIEDFIGRAKPTSDS